MTVLQMAYHQLTVNDVILILAIVLCSVMILGTIIAWIAELTSERNELKRKLEKLEEKEQRRKEREELLAELHKHKFVTKPVDIDSLPDGDIYLTGK